MPAFKVMSAIEIDVSADIVRKTLSDFNTWPIWSPWLITEREAQVSFKGHAGEVGHGTDWVGEKVGSGGITLTSLGAERMEADLQFIKPWKSQADITFEFTSTGIDKTQVKWHMKSGLPLAMFHMKKKMVAMISSDYNRGLNLLKDYLESGSIGSATTVEGVVDVPAMLYAGKTNTCLLKEMHSTMEESFPAVYKSIKEQGGEVNDKPFCIYKKMDVVKRESEFTVGVPVANKVGKSNGVICQVRPACKAFKVVHVGPYRHLGNAWSTAMQDMRHLKHKAKKKFPPFEVYVTSPEQTPEAELVTEIYIPVRG